MIIPILIEPNLKNTIWCNQLRKSIEDVILEKGYDSLFIDGNAYQNYDYNDLFDKNPRLLILFGTSPSWLQQVILCLSEKEIQIILLGNIASLTSKLHGQIFFDYEYSVQNLLCYLSACNCKKTALYGVFNNSSSDLIKKKAFLEYLNYNNIPDGNSYIFENHNNLKECYENFSTHIHDFDSAICVNEIVAASLSQKLHADGIRVPEDFQIITYGSSNLTLTATPPLSTYVVNHNTTATQAIRLFKFLYSANDPNIRVTIKLSGLIIPRDSTIRPIHEIPSCDEGFSAQVLETTAPSFYDDNTVTYFSKFEEFLQNCDTLDFDILRRILKDIPYERIAEELHTARNTVIYRLNKIQNALSVQNKKELKEFLKSNQFDDFFRYEV